LTTAPDISDEAVRKATGQGWDHWFRVLDRFGDGLDHTARARRLHETHPDLSGWWVQGVSVQYEKARGLRKHGEQSGGGFQVSCSRTLPMHIDEAWRRLMHRPFLGSHPWREGATWPTPDGVVEVRAVRPPKSMRFFWLDDAGRSTVEVRLDEKQDRTTVNFSHSDLRSDEAREAARRRWQDALAILGRDP
jgi:hypothetical protein